MASRGAGGDYGAVPGFGHSSGRGIRHRPPEWACGLSRLCSTEDASSGAATRVRPTAAPSDAAALRASRLTPAVWERPAPPFRSARVVVGLCATFLRTRRSAWPCTTLPNGFRHPGKARGRSRRTPNRLLLPLLLIALALAGCGASGPSPAQREAAKEAHEIVCNGAFWEPRKYECEHPQLVKAEEEERKRESPAIVGAEEQEAKAREAKEEAERAPEGGMPVCKSPSESGCLEPGTG